MVLFKEMFINLKVLKHNSKFNYFNTKSKRYKAATSLKTTVNCI